MGGNVTREDFEKNPVLGELLRVLEEPCKEQICVCGQCMNDNLKDIDSRNKTLSTEQSVNSKLDNIINNN